MLDVKGKNTKKDPPPNRQVRELEDLASSIRKASGRDKDPQGGCFCLAKLHPLSSYTPLCRDCGLILCQLNQPFHCCPYCLSDLLSASGRTSLVAKLETQIREVLAREAEQVRREAEAFPALPGVATPPRAGTPTSRTANHHASQMLRGKGPNAVVSRHPKTKGMKISLHPPSAGTPPKRSSLEDEKKQEVRIPRPPQNVRTVEELRPQFDSRDGFMATYIPATKQDRKEERVESNPSTW